MTPEELKKLRELAEKATPGPWEWASENYYDGVELTSREWLTANVDTACNAPSSTSDGKQIDNNLNYIAAANPSVILSLLDELEEHAAELHKAHIALDRIEKDTARNTVSSAFEIAVAAKHSIEVFNLHPNRRTRQKGASDECN